VTLHLGILQTDHVLTEFQETHGDYTDMFHGLFKSVSDEVVFTDYDVQLAVPDSLDCDAYVITGSRHSVYEDLPWIPDLVEFVRKILADQRQVIGICFGHQLIAHYFGGRTEASERGWGVGVHASEVLGQYPWMQSPRDQISLLCSHKDQVTALPTGAKLFLRSEFCPMAGYVIADQVVTVQGHPEFNKAYSGALLNKRRDILGESVFQQGVESLTQATDDELFARWLLKFAQGGDR